MILYIHYPTNETFFDVKLLKQHVARCYYCSCLLSPSFFFLRPDWHRNRCVLYRPFSSYVNKRPRPSLVNNLWSNEFFKYAYTYSFFFFILLFFSCMCKKKRKETRNKLCYSMSMNTDKATNTLDNILAYCNKFSLFLYCFNFGMTDFLFYWKKKVIKQTFIDLLSSIWLMDQTDERYTYRTDGIQLLLRKQIPFSFIYIYRRAV